MNDLFYWIFLSSGIFLGYFAVFVHLFKNRTDVEYVQIRLAAILSVLIAIAIAVKHSK